MTIPSIQFKNAETLTTTKEKTTCTNDAFSLVIVEQLIAWPLGRPIQQRFNMWAIKFI